MEDMKKLVERYKRELMEFSKNAVHEPPQTRLEFPEMTEDAPQEPAAQPEQEAVEVLSPAPTVQTEPEPRRPQIISFGAGEVTDRFEEIFSKFAPFDDDDSDKDYDDDLNDRDTDFDDDLDNRGSDGRFESSDFGVSTIIPEAAENLDDIPESGERPDEQLGRRDFEAQEETINSRDDIKPLRQQGIAPEIPSERSYASLQDFTDVNNRRGTARFRTYTARDALAVPNAKVVVSREIGGKQHVFYTLTTDESGQTPIISLPAPPKELSEAPDSPNTPYAPYDAVITADGFEEVIVRSMPVFEGVASIQRVALVPSVGNPPQIIENTEPSLNGGV